MMNFPVSARVDIRNGHPVLMVNDEPVPSLIYGLSDIPASRSWTEQAQRNIRNFAEAGIPVVQADTELRLCDMRNTGDFDPEPVRKEIRGCVEANPEALVMIRLHLNPSEAWMEAHPEELAGYFGHPAEVVITKRLIGGDFLRRRRVSLASSLWKKEYGELLARLLRTIADTPEGGHVIGIQVACGAYGEWHQWGGTRFPVDYGTAALRYFRERLRKKYGTAEVLRKAWRRDDVDFDTAEMPSPERRRQGRIGSFFDPVLDRDVMDSMESIQAAPAEAITYFCRIVHEAWPRPILAGAFYGYVFFVGRFASLSGHLEMKHVLNAPEVDFLAGPMPYQGPLREPGGLGCSRGLLESMRLGGKLWLTEMDQHPFGTERYIGGDPALRQETIACLRRDVLTPLLSGMGCWFYDHRLIPADQAADGDRSLYEKHGWWDTPELMREIRSENALYRKYGPRAYAPAADVALVCDRRSLYCFSENMNYEAPCDLRQEVRILNALGHSGAAYDMLDMEELESADLARYRVLLFYDTPFMTQEKRRFIAEKAACDGRTLIWGQAAGYLSESGADTANMERLTGIAVKTVPAEYHRMEYFHGYRGYPLTEPDAVDHTGGFWPIALRGFAPNFAPDDPAAEVYARFTGTSVPAVVKKQFAAHTAWYISQVPDSPEMLHEIFRQAGAHLYCAPGDLLQANGGLVMLHTVQGGPKTLTLRNGKTFQFTMPDNTTYVWDAVTGELVLA